MKTDFRIFPAHAALPGITVLDDGVIFSVSIKNAVSCGMILYHLPDGEAFEIPFSEEYRTGSLYSVKIEGVKPEKWAYRYIRDKKSFIDPCAVRICRIPASPKEGGNLPAGLICELPGQDRSFAVSSAEKWPDRILYQLHVRGFTASGTCDISEKLRGTFAALAEKIPYLLSLHVNAVEWMPVYERKPAPSFYRTTEKGTEELRDLWGFREGFYQALNRQFSSSKDTETEFQKTVNAFHSSGIRVYLQMYFPDNVPLHLRLSAIRFYALQYGIDGFHLIGNTDTARWAAGDPLLADIDLIADGFRYDQIQQENGNSEEGGIYIPSHLAETGITYRNLLRRFVKGDPMILREFLQQFLKVPRYHGCIRYAASYDGFSLRDVVSYNWKHNEKNQEENRDGEADNYSWNCGTEGTTDKRSIRNLRLRQSKNLMTLVFLAQGTPMIFSGDESGNSRDGNNNAYCQDNETGWVSWKPDREGRELLSFVRELSLLRKTYSCFRRSTGFTFADICGRGFPDVSFHGKEAWRPDFGADSRTIGILYDSCLPGEPLLYLGINMHWNRQELGLPGIPENMEWKCLMNTYEYHSFSDQPAVVSGQDHLMLRERSIQLLAAVLKTENKFT